MTNLSVEVQLLHVLVRVADADEGAQLRGGLRFGSRRSVSRCLALDGLPPPPPSVAIQVDARGRAEESLLVTVRFLRHFGVQNDHHHVAVFLQVAHHGLARQTLFLGSVQRRPVRINKRDKTQNGRPTPDGSLTHICRWGQAAKELTAATVGSEGSEPCPEAPGRKSGAAAEAAAAAGADAAAVADAAVVAAAAGADAVVAEKRGLRRDLPNARRRR
jgi:hypothetical protein